jgi:hypothetical protein
VKDKTLEQLIREYGRAQHLAGTYSWVGHGHAEAARSETEKADRLFLEIVSRLSGGPR